MFVDPNDYESKFKLPKNQKYMKINEGLKAYGGKDVKINVQKKQLTFEFEKVFSTAGLTFEIGQKYPVWIVWGLFENADDTKPELLMGNLDLNKPNYLEIQSPSSGEDYDMSASVRL